MLLISLSIQPSDLAVSSQVTSHPARETAPALLQSQSIPPSLIRDHPASFLALAYIDSGEGHEQLEFGTSGTDEAGP